MRAGTNKKDWICDENGAFIGLSLGFDFCYEHECGVDKLHRVLGLPKKEFPIGTVDRKISVSPDSLLFVEYEDKPKDKRRKKGVPAASLILANRHYYREMTHEEELKSFDLKFHSDVHDKWHRPELDNLMCSWSEDEFGINVRGAENVRRLREMYEAFQRLDIALAHPSSQGFLRTGLSLVIASRVSAEVEETVKAQDLAHQRLQLAAKATGVYEMLEKAGLRWFALSPSWDHYGEEDAVIFFLNPNQQDKYDSGWFTVEDLRAWAEGKGPVIKDKALDAFDKAHRDWKIDLHYGLKNQGLGLRRHSYLVWMDAEKTTVGVHVHPTRASAEALPEGSYPFDELMAKFAVTEATDSGT